MRPSPSPLRSGLPHEVNVLTLKGLVTLSDEHPLAPATEVLTALRAKTAPLETVHHAKTAPLETVHHELTAHSATVHPALTAHSATVHHALTAHSATVHPAVTAHTETVRHEEIVPTATVLRAPALQEAPSKPLVRKRNSAPTTAAAHVRADLWAHKPTSQRTNLANPANPANSPTNH